MVIIIFVYEFVNNIGATTTRHDDHARGAMTMHARGATIMHAARRLCTRRGDHACTRRDDHACTRRDDRARGATIMHAARRPCTRRDEHARGATTVHTDHAARRPRGTSTGLGIGFYRDVWSGSLRSRDPERVYRPKRRQCVSGLLF